MTVNAPTMLSLARQHLSEWGADIGLTTMLISFAEKLAALPPSQEVPAPPDTRFEKTKAGVIDWKMEAERANRLLLAWEGKKP